MRILTFDIETAPAKAYTWQMWKTNIAPVQLITPGCTLSWAAKWLGEAKSKTVYRSIWDQGDFISDLHDLLNEADMVVGYNSDKFDLRHVNREFTQKGFTPVRPLATVDLYKVVKRNFEFPYYRLDYVSQKLLGASKLETGGFELWPAFMAQDPKALKKMEKYNKQDVILTEKLYQYLLPWVNNHPFVGGGDIEIDDADVTYECPACGSTKTAKERPRRTRCFGIRTVRCMTCGSWSEGQRKRLS